MKKLIYSIMALAALTSCVKNEFDTQSGYPIDLSVTFETKAGGSDATSEPIVNSMRVLIFYGDTDGMTPTPGNLVVNNFYAFGFNTTRGTDKYTVSLANPIVLNQTDCRDFNIYVVLNEEGFQQPPVAPATDPTDLHKTLGDFEGPETDLQDILNNPVIYSEVLHNVDEPACLISGRKSVHFSDGELGAEKQVNIAAATGNPSNVDDYNRGRSMAQIIVEKITSEPAPGQEDYQSSNVPLIFVKSVTLENVPNTIAWSDEDGSTDGTAATKMAAQPVGSANSDGYYTREWYGHITRTINYLCAQKVQYTDAKFYRTASAIDDNKSKWSFSVKPYRTTDGTPGPGDPPYLYIYAHGKNIDPKTDADKAENAVMAIEKWDNNARTKLIAQLPNVFEAMQDDSNNPGHELDMSENITYTSYEVTDVQDTDGGGKTKTNIGPAIMSNDEYWTVRLGDKFYVPENIQDATTNATCLHVKLAIANPKFSFSLNKEKDKRVATEDCNDKNSGDKIADNVYKEGYHFVDPTTLPSPSSLPGESDLTYTYYAGDSETEKNINNIDGNWVKTYGSIVWADDETHVLALPTGNKDTYVDPDGLGSGQAGDHTAGYYVYIDGFSRKTAAVQSSIVVNETLVKQGAYFDWNVNASTQVYDFYIPVNNNIGGAATPDYSIHRNTKYTVTLYVNDATYTSMSTSSLSTKAGESAPFSITAKVTTETVSDYEE